MENSLSAPHPFFIATSEESQNIDTRTINEFGIDGFTLMETAGYASARELLDEVSEGNHGLFFCGKGNNAGDALVVARYLVQQGVDITLVFISGTENFSEDAGKNFELLRKIGESDTNCGTITICTSWDDFDIDTEADFIVDGMLGTGLDSKVRGDYNKAITWINEHRTETTIYAIDIPTGLHGDTGKVMGNAVAADHTFTFGILKQGLYLNKGPDYSGEVIYCELPFPNYLKESCSSFLIDESYIRADSRREPRHKYEAGVLYVIAGSEGLTGAAMLAAQSAWAEGIGAVILICPHGNLPVYEESLPQIIKHPVGKREDYCFKAEHLNEVRSRLSQKNGKILLGPGLGRDESTVDFVQELLASYSGDFVIDADALWCLSQSETWIKPDSSNWILTPHPGELSTLLAQPINDDYERLEFVRRIASEKKVTLVSKGFPVLVGVPSGEAYLTSYKTHKFSRAGFGDVLAGKIGAFWAQEYSPVKSSALALLDGKHILDELLYKDPDRIIEPKDFI